MEKMNVMQLVGKFLGEQIARIYEKIGLHTGDNSIHRTSEEIRAEITEGDIPSEIARQTEVEQALAGKVDRVDGKELMPSPGETPRRDRFLNEQGEYIPLESDYMVLDATMMGEKEFTVDQAQLQEYIDRAIIGGDSGLAVFFKFPFQYWNEYYKVTFVVHQLGNFYLRATHPIMYSAERKGIREYRYHFFFDIAGVRPFNPGKGMFVDSEFYVPDHLDTLLEAKASNVEVQAHVGNTENPHRVTKSQIGLENVENTADADKPVSKPMQQALDGIAGQLQSHAAESAIHRTSAQIRAEITDADIPGTVARDADVDTKIQAHNESGEAHADLRNALANLESGTVEAGSAVYAQKLGTTADSYTKTQLDAKLNRHIKDVVYDAGHAKFTFVFEDDREIVVDTPLENTVTDGHYDNETLELVLVLVSGQEIRIPVAGMTKVYTGKDTATATTTINDAGEVSVALKTGGVDAVHLSGALLSAINSHLTSTGDTKDNITTFPDQGTRTNLASGDKHAVLFGKIKRWFSDLKTVAFTGKASDLSQDTSNRLVTDTEKAGWNDKYTRAEVDTKDAGKANLVHTHTKAQITDFPAALPANGGNADTVGGQPILYLGRVVYPVADLDSNIGFYSGGFTPDAAGINPGAYGTILQVCNMPVSPVTGGAWVFQIAHAHEEERPQWRTQFNNKGWTAWKRLAFTDDLPVSLPANGGNADTVGGRRVAIQSVDITPSQLYNNIPVYTNAGYLNAVIFKDSWVVEDSNTISDICYRISKADGYHRWCSLARLKSVLGSMPASDVYAWAKQANKPTYNINEIYDADGVRVDAGTVNRKIFIANYKSEGYLSRAAIGLTNPIAAFSPVIISAGMDDQGNTWADWTFDPANGRITNPNGKAFAYTEEIPNVSNYLPLSGGAMAGMLSTCAMPGTFIEGMTRAAIKYNNLTAITNTAYHSFLAMKAQDNHILNFGGIGNDIGFRGYLGSRTQNGYDYRLSCNTADGSWTLENGRFYINSSAPEHVIMFQSFGVNTGYIGFGAYPTKDLQIMNYATGRYINIAADGKLYYNQKELATTDQINNLVTLNTSQTITGAKIFTQYCDFRAGAGNSGSDMRFKEKVRPVDEVLPGLLDLKVICYEWNKEGEQKRDTFGISATELEEKGGLFEKIVHERDDEQRTKWVEYDRVGVLALKGMQEMYHCWEAEKQELHRELADLKAELAGLRGFLHELK